MNIFKIISVIFLGTVSSYLVKIAYDNRLNYFLKLIKYGSIVKKKFSKCKKKISKNKKKLFTPTQLLVSGEFIKYKNLHLTDLNFEQSIENVSYYTGMINFILTYKYNNKEYYFIRKNYLINCVRDLKDFINELIKSDSESNSRVLNAEISIDNHNENITKDITSLIKKVEGYNKDFNLECVYIRDLYFFINKEINCTINEENEKTIKINIIDNLADEHIFRYDDKLSF